MFVFFSLLQTLDTVVDRVALDDDDEFRSTSSSLSVSVVQTSAKSKFVVRLIGFTEWRLVDEEVEDIAVDAEGLGFDSRAGQIGHMQCRHPCDDVSSDLCCPGANCGNGFRHSLNASAQ